MSWGTIKPDENQRVPGGITISRYFLKNHGHPALKKRSENIQGITIMPIPVHLFEECNPKTRFNWVVESSDDLAVKNIEELKSDGQIPHFIITQMSTWQILDFDECWQRSDGSLNGTTLGIAFTMDDGLLSWQYKITAIKHTAMLVAYLLKKYKLTTKNIYITKDCPVFFTSRWKEFKANVINQMKRL